MMYLRYMERDLAQIFPGLEEDLTLFIGIEYLCNTCLFAVKLKGFF